MMNMNDKQVHIYSVPTDSFYTDEEYRIHKKMMLNYRLKKNMNKRITKIDDKHKLEGIKKRKQLLESLTKQRKNKLLGLFNEQLEVRELRTDQLRDNRVISLFDSVLTRTLELEINKLTTDIIIVEKYFTDVFKDLVINGFTYDNQDYIYFSSSAGQIRNKKAVFIRKDLWDKHKNTLMCGLSEESINNQGGINLTKFQAYLSLCNSSSDEWTDFDINRTAVVDDMTLTINGLVDYIDPKTYKIERGKRMPVELEVMDGCGIMLPQVSKKSFQVRAPFLKGLLIPFSYDKFAKKHGTYIIKDIYGDEHDIRDLDVIFTKSQFKMHQYYKDWNDYKKKYDKYGCKAAKMNIEEVPDTVRLNYQYVQTLVDTTDKELEDLASKVIKDIEQIGTDKETMLNVLGADNENNHKDSYQKALSMYPELLNDTYSKKVIKDKKRSLIKDAKQAKFEIDGSFQFIVPDLYGFCEWLFGVNEGKGLLDDGEIYSRLHNEGICDILRSPHLSPEHGLRENVKREGLDDWFITDGIYISNWDLLPRLIQCDFDGDKVVVTQNKTLIQAAKRAMKGVLPLYYPMGKGDPELINGENIYNSLQRAYKANIGLISNDITKVLNSGDIDYDVISYLCMMNNHEIDRAKTNYFPKPPDKIKEQIEKHTNKKVPHFFRYVKDRKSHEVEEINNSTINRLNYIIKDKRINFKKVAGNFDYKMLMDGKRVEIDDELIQKYIELDRKKKWMMNGHDDGHGNHNYVYDKIKDELLAYGDEVKVCDMLIKYLYEEKESKHKGTLWKCFGDQIITNLRINLDISKQCEDCGSKYRQMTKMQVRCGKCQKERKRHSTKMRVRKTRAKQKGATKL